MMFDIRNSADKEDTLDIFIYSDIGRSWWDEDDTMSADKFRKALESHKNAKNVNLYINSSGGSVSEGVAIYSQIKRLNAQVTAYIDGFACSIASVIPMAADKVVMSDVSMMMVHNPWSLAMGNSKDLRKIADDLDKVLNGCILPAYRAKCGDKITDEKLIELVDGETFLTAQECLEYGFCDEILESSDEDKKAEAKKIIDDAVNKAKEEFMNHMRNKFSNSIEKSHENVRNEAPEEPAEPEQPAEPAEPEEPETPVSEPETPTEETHAETPVVDKSEIHNYFMKILKGEM